MRLLQAATAAILMCFTIHAYAIDCDGLDKKGNAYQTCMLRKENADREWNREQKKIEERKDQERRDYLNNYLKRTEPQTTKQNTNPEVFTKKQRDNFQWIKMKIGFAYETVEAGKCEVAKDALANADGNISENGTEGSGRAGDGTIITWKELREIYVTVKVLYMLKCLKDENMARDFLENQAALGSLAAKDILGMLTRVQEYPV